jgi:hypothetical protein
MSADLFAPCQLSDLTLANRLVMAPMTRNRAGEDGTVPPMMALLIRCAGTRQVSLVPVRESPCRTHGWQALSPRGSGSGGSSPVPGAIACEPSRPLACCGEHGPCRRGTAGRR